MALDDINIIKKLSVIHEPKEIYMYRKSGIAPLPKFTKTYPLHEEKEENSGSHDSERPFEAKFELRDI
jgi:hypothetical protein